MEPQTVKASKEVEPNKKEKHQWRHSRGLGYPGVNKLSWKFAFIFISLSCKITPKKVHCGVDKK